MNEIYATLQSLIKTSKESDVSDSDVFNSIKNLSDNCSHISLIRDMDTNLICHINKPAEDYFGISGKETTASGFSFSKRLLHPDFVEAQALVINFFSTPQNYHTVYEYMYYVTTVHGWKWMYSCSQCVSFSNDGRPKYVLAVAADVNDVINNTHSGGKLISDITSFQNIEYKRYQSLSKREAEILRLICKEFTTNEIAMKLFISKSTVDSHRKTMLKKLNVKNAIGLAKYVHLFDADNA